MYKCGDIIESYRLLDECGSGAYGTVFRAENTVTGKFCALKIVYTHGKHYERELKGLTNYQHRCRHQSLMPVHHVGHLDDCIYYTMDLADNLSGCDEYVPDTLANRLERHGPLKPDAIIQMCLEILDGLEVIHSHGLVHRDIKPDNILWINGQAALADIGLTADNGQTTFAGTPGFLAPAILNGQNNADSANDLYALGKVLYCALTGNNVKDFPHFPNAQTLTSSGGIVRTYTLACESGSPIRTVADFRSSLQGCMPKRQRSWKILGGYLILLCILLFVIGRLINYMVQSAQPDKQDVSEPQMHYQKSTYESSGQTADDTAF